LSETSYPEVVTSTPTHESEASTAVVPAQDPAAPERLRVRARRRRWILVSVLVVLLLGSVGAGAYLWQVAEAWIERDQQWRSHSIALTTTLGETSSELEDTVAELAVVRGQLDQAQTRISELADEKARLGDEHAVVRQLAEYQERVSEAAAAVVTALDSCIATQQQLVRWYAEDVEREPEELEELAALDAAVDEVCTAAQEAKDALQEELDG